MMDCHDPDGIASDPGRTEAAGGPLLLRPVRAIVNDVRQLHRFRFVLSNFVTSQLKVRYQRSILGFLWTLLNPILMMTILTLVFSQVMNIPIREYAIYLFSGMIPWQFFAASVANASRSLINQEYLIRKVSVQKLVFPLADVLVSTVNMCFAMLALFILLQFFSPDLHVQLVLIVPGTIMLLTFGFGVSLLAMTAVTRFRDFEHMIGVFLQAFYFACPILYLPEMVGRYRWLLDLNPMTHLLAFFQAAFYYGAWPTSGTWAMAALSAGGSLALGYILYKRYEDEYIFLL